MAKVVEKATSVTYVDDKRAQYARLVVFNHGVAEKVIGKGKDVNSATKAEIEKAAKSLNGGTLLDGKEGIELIQKLSKAGATDANVAKRGLTTAYAQEVRPFLRRLQLAESFGRRGKKAAEKPAAAKKEPKGKAKAATAEPEPEPAAE